MRARPAAAALALAAFAVGCGSSAPAGPAPAAQAPPGGSAFLATSMATAAGTWAVVVMGGSVASHNDFWQLLARPAGSSTWRLITPPGVADNGGLVVAGLGGQSLVTAFRPSQRLTFTPLTVTSDSGRAWAAAGPLDAALADTPDALAAAPGTGRLLAVTGSGTARLAAPGYTVWHVLATKAALAAAPAGRACRLQAVTSAAFSPSGTPLLAGRCGRAGTAAIFANRDGTWQAAGPPIPAALARQHITVLRLTRTGSGIAALLGAGRSLLAAWSADSGSHWAVSSPVSLGGGRLTSASFGPASAIAVVLTGSRAETIAGAGAGWRSLPALPAGTATLSVGRAGGLDALAVHRTRLTIWELAAGSATWRAMQALSVPVQFGSSG